MYFLKTIFFFFIVVGGIVSCGQQPSSISEKKSPTNFQDILSENIQPSRNQYINESSAFERVPLACATQDVFFEQKIWPLIKKDCLGCHANSIIESPLEFFDEKVSNYLKKNYVSFRQNSSIKDATGAVVLLKKIANINNTHIGGEIFSRNDSEYVLFKNMVDRLNGCVQVKVNRTNIVMGRPLEQLRKITLSLSGRLPTRIEVQKITNVVDQLQLNVELAAIIHQLLTEDGFYLKLKEIYNDVLLTGLYEKEAKALNLDLSAFDNGNYFSNVKLMEQGYNGTQSNNIRNAANFGVAHAPLALVEYVVRNDLPFTEILTAEYVMVNPYSATLFNALVDGGFDFNFNYGDAPSSFDENLFVPVRLFDSAGRKIPHAGILTTLPYLNRYDSTNTNRNRKRARYVYANFLGVDVERIASRSTLNLNDVIGRTPTLEDPQCKVCHDVLDPVAGLFKNWNDNGLYIGDNQNWFNTKLPAEMLPPGFLNNTLPANNSATSLEWLAKVLVQDDRFALATVKIIYRGLMGQVVTDSQLLQTLRNLFVNSQFNLKTLVKAIVQNDRFLAANANVFADDFDVVAQEYGTARLLTPLQLHRKISTIFNGTQWLSPSKRNLLSVDSYRIFYGGINSGDISDRTTQPTSLIAGVQMRIANQLACQLVPIDFSLPQFQRTLFPRVNVFDVPETIEGGVNIRENIKFLYQKILGEKLSTNHVEINRIFNLFVSVRNALGVEPVVRECRKGLSNQSEIIIDENKTVRSWMAVINFMLRDYGFLYE